MKITTLQLMAFCGALLYIGIYHIQGLAVETLAPIKALPILLLVVMVRVLGDGRPYANRIACGLSLGGVGNICFELEGRVSPYGISLFSIGMIFFLFGMVAYAYAFLANDVKFSFVASSLAFAYAAAVYGVLRPKLPDAIVASIFVYAVVAAIMMALAFARVPEGFSYRWSSWCSIGGTVLFTVTSTILGYDRFVTAVPNAKVIFLSTYYVAQFLTAMSAKGSQVRPLTRSLGSVENFQNGQSFRSADMD